MSRIVASQLNTPLNPEGLPTAAAWEHAQPVAFCADWRGQSPDPLRETQTRMLWSQEFLYFHFRCRYREIYVDTPGIGRRDMLWEKDVAEVFIRPPENELRHYLEFEVSPNGDWLDLDIAPGKKSILCCDIKSRVLVHSETRVWTAEMAIPLSCLTAKLDPRDSWRLNLFRIEGREPDRFYSAWQPTHTPQPNFHVPEVFSELHFSS